MTHRLLAILGSIAFGIRQFAGSLLSFVGLRGLARFAVPLLIVGLAAATFVSARDTAAILGSRPDVQQTTLSEVAARSEDAGGSIWFEFDALVDQTHLELPVDRGTFFYLARDPDDPTTGLLVRSPLNDTFFRQRVVTARLTEDDAVIADAVGALGALPTGFDLDDARYLDELDAGGAADTAFVPSQLGEEAPGGELLVTGRVLSPATFAACAVEAGCDGADAAWFYYFADPEGGATTILRSPQPPQALPVRLQGLFQRDTFDLAPVLASDWFAALDADVPTERAFSAGRRPPILQPVSYVPSIIFGGLAVLLLGSLLAGYPVFGKTARPAPARTFAPGEGIDLEITGRMERDPNVIVLDRSPGALERLTIPELALRLWRYGLLPRDLSRREAEQRFMAESSGETDRLVLHERDQSALVTIDGSTPGLQVETGRLYRVGRSWPALHVRQGATNAYLAIGSQDDRDRAAAELLAEAEGQPG